MPSINARKNQHSSVWMIILILLLFVVLSSPAQPVLLYGADFPDEDWWAGPYWSLEPNCYYFDETVYSSITWNYITDSLVSPQIATIPENVDSLLIVLNCDFHFSAFIYNYAMAMYSCSMIVNGECCWIEEGYFSMTYGAIFHGPAIASLSVTPGDSLHVKLIAQIGAIMMQPPYYSTGHLRWKIHDIAIFGYTSGGTNLERTTWGDIKAIYL